MTQLAKHEDHGAETEQRAMVSLIERVAMSPDVPFEKLEKMLDMQERLWAREARRAFDLAIAEAKAEIPPILKTGEVDYVNSKGQRTHFKHETLDGIARIVDPLLSERGLSYRFRSGQQDGMLQVTCILAHRDGYSEETTLQGAPDTSGSKNNYQAVGSAATYLQRYTLKLALGLSAARDDDAKGTGADVPSAISEEQYHEIRDLIEKAGVEEEVVLKAAGIQMLDELPASKFPALKSKLAKTIEAKKGGAA